MHKKSQTTRRALAPIEPHHHMPASAPHCFIAATSIPESRASSDIGGCQSVRRYLAHHGFSYDLNVRLLDLGVAEAARRFDRQDIEPVVVTAQAHRSNSKPLRVLDGKDKMTGHADKFVAERARGCDSLKARSECFSTPYGSTSKFAKRSRQLLELEGLGRWICEEEVYIAMLV